MALYLGHGIGFNDQRAPRATRSLGKIGKKKDKKRFSAYRFHDDDPVFFQDGLRLTCRCGETEHGQPDDGNGYLDPKPTRDTTYAWVYHMR
ncbi:MAG: hypothetical protein RRC34_12410 [Lentisphaeria bacterium]|nr:hypothetical protein [Lentisphaeria bacterium]